MDLFDLEALEVIEAAERILQGILEEEGAYV